MSFFQKTAIFFVTLSAVTMSAFAAFTYDSFSAGKNINIVSLYENRVYDSLECNGCEASSLKFAEDRLSKDLKKIIKYRIMSGYKPDDIVPFMIKKYGDFLSLKAGFSLKTYLPWLAVFLFAVSSVFVGKFYYEKLPAPYRGAKTFSPKMKDNILYKKSRT